MLTLKSILFKLSIVFFSLAFIFSGIVFFFYFKDSAFIKESLATKATIVNIIKTHSSEGNTSYYPVCEFHDSNGIAIHFKSDMGSPDKDKYKVGQEIEVLYSQKDPQKCYINAFFSIWLGTFVSTFLAVSLFISAIFCLLLSWVITPLKGTTEENTGIATDKSRVAAYFLAVYLGFLGIHNFYLGYMKKAVIQLLISVFICGIGVPVSFIWALVDALRLDNNFFKWQTKIEKDALGNPLHGKITLLHHVLGVFVPVTAFLLIVTLTVLDFYAQPIFTIEEHPKTNVLQEEITDSGVLPLNTKTSAMVTNPQAAAITDEATNKKDNIPTPASIPAPEVSSKNKNQTFAIIKAVYGTKEKHTDVTENLKKLIKDDKLDCVVTPKTLANGVDPAHGIVKILLVEYEYNGKRIRGKYKDKTHLHLPDVKEAENETQSTQ